MSNTSVKKETLGLCTFNTRGLGEATKRRAVFRWLKQYHKGVILLQETHTNDNMLKQWSSEWQGQIFMSHGSTTARGVAILISAGIDITVNNVETDDNGRFILLNTTFDDQTLIIVNIYAPTKDRIDSQREFLVFVHEQIVDYMEKHILLGGDFNVCLQPEIDKKGGILEKQSDSANIIETMMEEFDLIDVWRLFNPHALRYTRREITRKGLVQSRLDYWLVSSHLLYNFSSHDIKPGLRSDHSIVEITFDITNSQKRGRGFFKFNASLLKDVDYVSKINNLIDNYLEVNKDETNDALKWDYLKCEIRGLTISHASFKAKEKRKQINCLKNRLASLEINLSDKNMNIYKNVKSELEQIFKEEAKGHYIRSRSHIIEESPENLKYFSKLEIKNANSKYIKTLNVKGNLISDPSHILNAQKDFYETLYKEHEKEVDESLFQNIEIPKLDDLETEICEKLITKEELGNALKELPNNKTPGSDGLTAEFYKFFWSKIKGLVYKSFIYAMNNSSLTIEQRRGILNIIPKKDKDLRHLANWRPLTLLNTDYKILTKLLALRLQKVLPSIISPDQTGYLKGRYIGDNIRTIFDIIEYTKIKQIPGMMVLIDFEKAFDSISWNFLFKTLDAFNFGDNFKKWIKIIYSNPECCVTNNGFASSFFPISRGIRQGCPISALLFILVVEIMSLHIKQNQDITGIIVGNSSIKVSQLADDTTLFLKDTHSLKVALEFLEKFKLSSGLKLNKIKTEVIWIGAETKCIEKPLGLKITNTTVRCLGILCNTDINSVIKENFTTKIKKIKKLLGVWCQRNLSLKGRITFLQTMALPIILYPASVLPIPQWVIKEIEKIFFSFVWCYKKPLVKKDL